MTTKEKRNEIYTFIKTNIGEIKPEKQKILSQLVKDYAKFHNQVIVKELTELKSKPLIKEVKSVVIQSKKPKINSIKYDPNYFNADFLKR